MTIGALIAFQLVFDLLVVLLLVAVARGRRAPVAPPAWHDEFLQLAKEVMAVADSLLDAPERRAPVPLARPTAPAERRPVGARDEAFALLRGGMEPDAVARRTGLLPGELRLITSLVAAQRRADASDTRQALPTAEARRRGGSLQRGDFPDPEPLAARGTGLA